MPDCAEVTTATQAMRQRPAAIFFMSALYDSSASCRPPTSTRTCAAESATSARRFPTRTGASSTRARAYPDAFVEALTDAGYLAALIPEEYGGSGLGVTEASVILEEINRSGGNSGACHAQMYTMGTLLRHGSDAQKRDVPAADRQRRAAAAGVRRERTDDRLRHDAAQDDGDAQGRPLRHPRPEGLDLARRALGSAAARRAHDADRTGEEADRRPVDAARRSAHGGRPRPDHPADPDDDESRDDGAVLRRPRGAGRRAGRRGRQGLPVSASTA